LGASLCCATEPREIAITGMAIKEASFNPFSDVVCRAKLERFIMFSNQ
jgi:hypothetical protein